MSGTPSEAEIQTQWKNAVNLLESIRNYADGTVALGGGLLDVIEQSLEGVYLPPALSGFTARIRSTLSSIVDPARAAEALYPVLYEYAALFSSGAGGNYTSPEQLSRALYDHLVKTAATIKSRAITFDTSATLSVLNTNVGNYSVTRLTVDENGYPLEACVVETKTIRCRQDRNTGTQQHAEVFEVIGKAASTDNLMRANYGSGNTGETLRAMNAGASTGGSILNNSTFSNYTATATPKFSGWTQTAGGASLTQDLVNFYRGSPGSSPDASLKITAVGAATTTITQTMDLMRTTTLDFSRPYFLRVMINKLTGTAVGGTVTIRCGSQSASVTIAAMSAAGTGWQELTLPLTSVCWPKNFNENDFSVEIEWSSQTSGYLLVDDVIFTRWQEVDGTYWSIRPNTASTAVINPLVNDTWEFTDTGGAPATGKLQYWWYMAGLGYLPNSGAPTITDP